VAVAVSVGVTVAVTGGGWLPGVGDPVSVVRPQADTVSSATTAMLMLSRSGLRPVL